jgi:4-hydroxybenzoate polyprenyltransferase
MIAERIEQYAYLIRLHKPIGILLLLWPTMWALWIAASGHPDKGTLLIFMAGVVLMRSAGCVANDLADRHLDGHVLRTRMRPLASGLVSVREAILLAGALGLVAFILVLFCNAMTIQLSFAGALLAIIYPFLKRVTHLPQLGLGMAFAWGVPMAFAAETNTLTSAMWWLFATSMLWPVIYDTMYAMADRDDDQKIGIKSTAILFGRWDVVCLLVLQFIFLAMLVVTGVIFHLHYFYYASLGVVFLLFVRQYFLIKERNSEKCFAAFMHNNWVGLTIFIGILLSYY